MKSELLRWNVNFLIVYKFLNLFYVILLCLIVAIHTIYSINYNICILPCALLVKFYILYSYSVKNKLSRKNKLQSMSFQDRSLIDCNK